MESRRHKPARGAERRPARELEGERRFTVLALSRVNDRGEYGPDVPHLKLCGRWLELAGFAIGRKVRVEVERGRLVLTPQEPAPCK
jgi:sarcosine oxidase delta subunit